MGGNCRQSTVSTHQNTNWLKHKIFYGDRKEGYFMMRSTYRLRQTPFETRWLRKTPLATSWLMLVAIKVQIYL